MSSPIIVPSRRLFLASAAPAAAVLDRPRGVRRRADQDARRRPRGRSTPTSCRSTPTTTCSSSTTASRPAVGEITHLTGKILDAKGNPVRNALVEIWQCDANGVYLHTADSDRKKDKQDKNFQGFGRFLTGSTGEYYFRTIKPVPVPRPHAAHPLQDQEGRQGTAHHAVLRQGPPGQRRRTASGAASATTSSATRSPSTFAKMKDSKIGELARQLRRSCWARRRQER